ncbi:Vacuolar protein sorting-associated protein 8 [Ascosphaera acerosa]|nr:Vacuolar protein sorting-associated protein 8 [Ascosphaera acerosa]
MAAGSGKGGAEEVDAGLDNDHAERLAELPGSSSHRSDSATEKAQRPASPSQPVSDGLRDGQQSAMIDLSHAIGAADPPGLSMSPDLGPSVVLSPASSRQSSFSHGRSFTGVRTSHRPFDLRFSSRIASSPFARSTLGLPSTRTPSIASRFGGSAAPDDVERTSAPWEVIRWMNLTKVAGHAFSELGKRTYGQPSCLAVSTLIVIGTRKGLLLVFDYQQTLKHIIGQGSKASTCGAVTSVAISADHTVVAAGHENGSIFTWDLARPARPFLSIAPITAEQVGLTGISGHLVGASVIHVGFLGIRRTALASADNRGMAFSHLATRGTGPIGRRVKTTRILGRYPADQVVQGTRRKPSSVLAFAPLPLGNVEQKTDTMGLVAMLTPYLLVIVSTTPVAETQYKIGRPREMAAHSTLTACLAWFPAILLKNTESEVSKAKLVYCWSNVLTIVVVTEVSPDPDDKERPPTFTFTPTQRWVAPEPIVAVQWISRSVLAVLTITQRLLILEDRSLRMTDSFDMVNKQIYHANLFGSQLQSLVETLDEEDSSMHGVAADAFYMSFQSYKGRLFLLGLNGLSIGAVTNWADRLHALMDAADYVSAISLARSYYTGSSDKVTIGLPEDDNSRHALVSAKMMQIISAASKHIFERPAAAEPTGATEVSRLGEFADACISACVLLGNQQLLFDDVYDYFEDSGNTEVFLDALEPYITEGDIRSLPPRTLKALIIQFSQAHTGQQLEHLICLLDTSAMDIDQVTTLCKSYGLYDAYVYVWTQALKDYLGPIAVLLQTCTATNDNSSGGPVTDDTNASRLFSYMTYTLLGRIYPTGDALDGPTASSAKASLYSYLFVSASTEGGLQNLRSLLLLDSASFMSMLNEAFEDNFLNDPAQQTNDSAEMITLNRQYIVSILLDVMNDDPEFTPLVTIYFDMFIARNLPKYPQYILLPGSTLQAVLERLCEYPLLSMRDDCQLSVECLLSKYKPPGIQDFIPMFQRAGFYRILKSVYRSEARYAEWVTACFDDDEDKAAVFTAVRECLRRSSPLTSQQRHDVETVVEAHAADLTTIDAHEAARMMDEVAPYMHQVIVEALDQRPHAQYDYLKGLLDSQQQEARQRRAYDPVLVQRYLKLACDFDKQHLMTFINQLADTHNVLQLNIDSLVSMMEDRGIIDAAVVLLTHDGQYQRAMTRTTQHLQVLGTGLVHTISSPAATPADRSQLLQSIVQYANVGLWLCQRLGKSKSLGNGRDQEQRQGGRGLPPAERVAALKRPLNDHEALWLDLIETVVSIARAVATQARLSKAATASEDLQASAACSASDGIDEIVTTVHGLVQTVFTSLLERTSGRREVGGHDIDMTFLRILRAFLARAATASPSLDEMRAVLRSIFATYTYERSLLSLANSMLDKDLFIHMNGLAHLRQRGWRPRSRFCPECKRRLWGPGGGEHIWEAWDSRSKQPLLRKSVTHLPVPTDGKYSLLSQETDLKGKSRAAGSDAQALSNETIEPTRDRTTSMASLPALSTTYTDVGNQIAESSDLIAFACRHTYHRSCISGNTPDASASGQTASRGTPPASLVCPRCANTH